MAPTPAEGRQAATVEQARAAFDGLDFERAAELAREALTGSLSDQDRVGALEVLGYAYGILAEEDQAVRTLGEMIVLDPDREPDRQALPPRVTALYDQAFEQVLVVRRILVDSTGFVSGDGSVTLHYEVSRAATATLRLIGTDIDRVIATQITTPGQTDRFDWDAMIDGAPVPEGAYQLLVTASEGRNQYQRLAGFRVEHAPVDTTAHETSIVGFEKVPETEIPPRDWRPLGVTTLLTGAVAGAALTLGNSVFEGSRVELGVGALLSIGAGLAVSLRQPEPRPVPTAIQLNQLIDQSLADRNARIAAANEELRRRVRLTVVQVNP